MNGYRARSGQGAAGWEDGERMFFDRNAAALLGTDPAHADLLGRLQAVAPASDFAFYESAGGELTLLYREVLLHDLSGPTQEAQGVIDTQAAPGPHRLHLIFGLGLGYLPDLLCRQSEGFVVIYEPDLPFLRFVLENLDCSDFLPSGRVWIVASQADLLALLRRKLYGALALDILLLPAYAYLLAPEIPSLMAALAEMERDRATDGRTGRAFHLQWLRQCLENVPVLAAIPTAERLQGQFSGRPALVIGRGPSLDAAMPALKKLMDAAVLIAVGGALHCLYAAGVTPDFAVFYDANGLQEQLHDLPEAYLRQIVFLVSPLAQPACLRSPARGKLAFLSHNHPQVADWLDATLGRSHPRLEGGGTVSLIAFQSALWMGCNPVVLVGQDLAFPDHQVYAGGVTVQQDEAGRLALTPNDALYAAPETMDVVPGQHGQPLPALAAYAGFIRHFADLARQNAASASPVSLYNASLGGAQIDGFQLTPLAALATEFAPWKTAAHSQCLALLAELPLERQAERRAAFGQALAEMVNQVAEALLLCEQLHARLCEDVQTVSLETLQAVNRTWRTFLDERPWLAFWCLYAVMDFQQGLGAVPAVETPEFTARFRERLQALLTECATLLRAQAVPAL